MLIIFFIIFGIIGLCLMFDRDFLGQLRFKTKFIFYLLCLLIMFICNNFLTVIYAGLVYLYCKYKKYKRYKGEKNG